MSKRFTYWNSFASSTPLYLDLFTGAFQCCSVRLERTLYAGALMGIRRSSDNALKDFFPDSNDTLSLLSEDGLGTSLGTWIGASDGFIYNFFDQTTNSNDWLQPTTSQQPQIISSGSLLVDGNGLAAPTLSGSSNNGFILAGFQGHAVCDSDQVLTTSDTSFTTYNRPAIYFSFVAQSGSSSTSINGQYGSPTLYVNGALPTQVTRNDCFLAQTGTNKVITHQGADTTDSNWGMPNTSFGGYPSGFEVAGILQFNASFASDQSANRAARHVYLQAKYQ